MKKNKVKFYASSLYKNLGFYGREMAVDWEEESIHQFRVTYKKLRAFVRLVNEGSCYKVIQMPGKLKKIYALAGAVRDRQLQQERLQQSAGTEFTGLTELSFFNSNETREIQSKLLGLLKGDAIAQTKKRMMKTFPDRFELPDFTECFRTKCFASSRLLGLRPLTDERIHAIRKILKDLIYNLEIYRMEDRFPAGTWKEKVTAYFDPLLEQLGGYQDICTAITFVESLWLQNLHTAYREPLALMVEAWDNERVASRQLLVKRLCSDEVLATGLVEDLPIILYSEI